MAAQHRQLRELDRAPQVRRRRAEGGAGPHVRWRTWFLRRLLRGGGRSRTGSTGCVRQVQRGRHTALPGGERLAGLARRGEGGGSVKLVCTAYRAALRLCRRASAEC